MSIIKADFNEYCTCCGLNNINLYENTHKCVICTRLDRLEEKIKEVENDVKER